MTYLVAFLILANGASVVLPVTVHDGQHTCEAAKLKLMREVQRNHRDSTLTASCLSR